MTLASNLLSYYKFHFGLSFESFSFFKNFQHNVFPNQHIFHSYMFVQIMVSYKPENRRKGDVKHDAKDRSIIYVNHSSKACAKRENNEMSKGKESRTSRT